jgi:peroxiredoxin
MPRSRVLTYCIALLLLVLGGCGADESPSPADAPKTSQEARSGTSYQTDPVPAPDLDLETMDGDTINLAQQDGNVVLVNFWATWCAPCRKEIPDLVDLYDELQPKGLEIVGIAVDQEGAEVVKPFVEEQNINYPIVLDPDQSTEKHFEAMYGLPTTYVVNPEGKIVRRILGIFPIDEMKPKLQEMLSSEPTN